MSSAKSKTKTRILRIVACAFVAIVALQLGASVAAFAQSAIYTPGLNNPGNPNPGAGIDQQPPPIGDGQQPSPVDPGDLGPALPPPTDPADKTTGSAFGTQIGQDRTIVHIFVNNRMVQTIRPDQLTSAQISQIDGILGITMENGQDSIDVSATADQIAQIQQVMQAWPGGWQMVNGKKQITTDQPGPGYPKHLPSYTFQGPLTTVPIMVRWMIIAGVVCATIWVAVGALCMSFGLPDQGVKMAQTFFGICILLSSYTVFKLVQGNAIKKTFETMATGGNRPTTASVDESNLSQSSTPQIPLSDPFSAPRAGIPVAPLAEQQTYGSSQ